MTLPHYTRQETVPQPYPLMPALDMWKIVIVLFKITFRLWHTSLLYKCSAWAKIHGSLNQLNSAYFPLSYLGHQFFRGIKVNFLLHWFRRWLWSCPFKLKTYVSPFLHITKTAPTKLVIEMLLIVSKHPYHRDLNMA